jgi:hypothetical protein
MEDHINTNLIERAGEVMAYFEGTDLETAIANNLDRNDLEMVNHLVVEAEAEISRQEFNRYDI